MNKENTQELVLKSLNWRYATKVFDPTKKLDETTLHTIIESGRLSPSSLGLEPWQFFVINDTITRKKLFEASNQQKVLDASHLIVITAQTNIEQIIDERIDRAARIQNQKTEELSAYRAFLENSILAKKSDGSLISWLKAQTYIPLESMIMTASLLGVDNGPMEGFDSKQVDEILNLNSHNLTAVTMLALGYRGEDPASLRPKVRKDFKEAVRVI
jgi:nitroreductase